MNLLDQHDEPQTAVSPFTTSHWLQNVVYPLLIALMVTLLFVAISTALKIATPGFRWQALTALIFLATLEGVYGSRWLRSFEQIVVNRALYRAAEFALLALIIRIYAWFAVGNGFPTWLTIQQYLRYPLDFFADPFFLSTLVLTLLAWQRGIAFGTLFHELAISRAEEAYFQSDSKQDRWHNDAPIRAMRSNLVTSFFQQWVWGGILLVFCVGLSTFQLNEVSGINLLALARRSLQPQLLLVMLLYFLIGFWLLSQARLAVLNGRWLFEGVTTAPQLSRSWSRSSLRTLLLIALFAAFIPIGSTFPAARLVTALLGGLLYVINLIFYLLTFLFVTFLSLLFPRGEVVPEPALPAPPPPPPEILPPPTAAAGGEMLAMFASSLFWTAVLIGTAAAILFVLSDRGQHLNRQLWQRFWLSLKQWLRELWGGLGQQISSLRQLLPVASARVNEADEQGENGRFPRFFRLNALPPRDQIRYFYLSTLKRAKQQGVARPPQQTPSEYAAQLKANWPDADAEIDQLTAAFLDAQYNPAPITATTVSPIKEAWQRLKRLLRTRARSTQ